MMDIASLPGAMALVSGSSRATVTTLYWGYAHTIFKDLLCPCLTVFAFILGEYTSLLSGGCEDIKDAKWAWVSWMIAATLNGWAPPTLENVAPVTPNCNFLDGAESGRLYQFVPQMIAQQAAIAGDAVASFEQA